MHKYQLKHLHTIKQLVIIYSNYESIREYIVCWCLRLEDYAGLKIAKNENYQSFIYNYLPR